MSYAPLPRPAMGITTGSTSSLLLWFAVAAAAGVAAAYLLRGPEPRRRASGSPGEIDLGGWWVLGYNYDPDDKAHEKDVRLKTEWGPYRSRKEASKVAAREGDTWATRVVRLGGFLDPAPESYQRPNRRRRRR